jgi:uncharacterized membrane protein required for colicin V production
MADQKGLRAIGFGFGAITLTVTFVAMMLVADAAMRPAHDTKSVVASATQ